MFPFTFFDTYSISVLQINILFNNKGDLINEIFIFALM